MNERELTQHLRELTLAAPPESWRDEILAESRTIVPLAQPKPTTTRAQWLARAAVVFVWVGIAVSHFQGKHKDTRLATYLAPSHLPCPIPITGEEIEWLMAQLFPTKEDSQLQDPYYHHSHNLSDPI